MHNPSTAEASALRVKYLIGVRQLHRRRGICFLIEMAASLRRSATQSASKRAMKQFKKPTEAGTAVRVHTSDSGTPSGR